MPAIFTGEFLGTAFLILFGTGVVANVVTKNSKGQQSGWIVITFGWAIAVFTGVFVSAAMSGAHLNPAVTFAMWWLGKTSAADLPLYLGGQFAGAITGATLTWLAYRRHIDETDDAGLKLAIFSTAPQYRDPVQNLITEAIGTAALVLGVLYIASPAQTLGALDALPVALLVLGIGLSLGGPTGYAINPARDLGPRIAHFLLPIRGKGSSDWAYAWIPVAGPIAGATAAALVWQMLQ